MIEKFVTNLHDKREYGMHIRNLNQLLNHGLIFKKVHKVIKFNQEALLEQFIDINIEPRKKAKIAFEKDFF